MKRREHVLSRSLPSVLVTGGTRRLGWEICRRSLELGLGVVAHYRSADARARAWKSAHPVHGQRLAFLQADLSQPCAHVIDAALAVAPLLQGLVNNAAVFDAGNLLEEGSFAGMLRTNALAPLDLCRRLAARVRKGWVVNITDARIAGVNLRFQNYRVSKLVLTELTRQLAVLLAPRFRVNAIAPGPVLRPPGMPTRDFMTLRNRAAPLSRKPTVADVLHAYEYLYRSPTVTGQVLFVDAGWHLV